MIYSIYPTLYFVDLMRIPITYLMTGRDKHVVLWSIHDHIATLATEAGPDAKQGSNVGGSGEKTAESPSVGPRGIYRGHKDTVEDVQFCPSR